MVRTRITLMAMCLASFPMAVPTAVLAEARCHVPMAQWQPKDALDSRLKAEGWTRATIRTDDGCYKVRATGPDGKRLKAKFDPATLEKLGTTNSDD